MKKNKNTKYKIIILFFLAIITTSIRFTLARYNLIFNNDGSANSAKWNIVLKKNGKPVSNTFAFNLADTKLANEYVQAGIIAPGDSGLITLNLTDTGTQIEYQYKIELNATQFTKNNGNIKFYSDAEMTIQWSNNWIYVPFAEVGKQNITKILYWKWDIGEENNLNDTRAGKESQTLGFTLTIAAEQKKYNNANKKA